MKIGVLGTGMVGVAIASRLVELGHQVQMGARKAGGNSATAWAASVGSLGSEGTFADAAGMADLVFSCTSGAHAVEALSAAGEDNLAGKTIIDVTNPLVFGDDGASLSVINTDSLGEQIQRAFPRSHVVKSLNTMNADIMVRPSTLGAEHVVFVCGNSPEAKEETCTLLAEFGWGPGQIVDLGDITAARGTEAWLLLWLRLMGALGTPHFNAAIAR